MQRIKQHILVPKFDLILPVIFHIFANVSAEWTEVNTLCPDHRTRQLKKCPDKWSGHINNLTSNQLTSIFNQLFNTLLKMRINGKSLWNKEGVEMAQVQNSKLQSHEIICIIYQITVSKKCIQIEKTAPTNDQCWFVCSEIKWHRGISSPSKSAKKKTCSQMKFGGHAKLLSADPNRTLTMVKDVLKHPSGCFVY